MSEYKRNLHCQDCGFKFILITYRKSKKKLKTDKPRIFCPRCGECFVKINTRSCVHWTAEEEKSLLEKVEAGAKWYVLEKEFNRTIPAIKRKFSRLAGIKV